MKNKCSKKDLLTYTYDTIKKFKEGIIEHNLNFKNSSRYKIKYKFWNVCDKREYKLLIANQMQDSKRKLFQNLALKG